MVGACTGTICDYVFSRAYDLRRHLRTEPVDEWVERTKAKVRKNASAYGKCLKLGGQCLIYRCHCDDVQCSNNINALA